MSDDRELRDALEKAQSRTKTLERLLAEESEDREALTLELLTLREELEEAERKLLPAPGESRELVRLHAQLNAQQLQVTNLTLERDRLLEKVAQLTRKPSEQLAELIRLRARLAELERLSDAPSSPV